MNKQNFCGTRSLVALAIRRDRIRLPAWIFGISLMVFLILVAYDEFSAREMQEIITMASASQGMRMLVAPVRAGQMGALGSFFLFRTSFLISILVAMMNTQLVVRHTRHNEETACSEMIGSAVVGRYASLTAGLIIAFAANCLLFVLLLAGFVANQLPFAGSVAAALSFASLGLVYAAFAAVAAQLSDSSRTASGLSTIVLAVTFLINAIGNVMGTVHDLAMGYTSGWLVWLSPIGWIQQVQAFDQNRMILLLLPVALFIISAMLAVWLSSRRDIGRGILPSARGRAAASCWLSGSLGLAWRLQYKTLLGWMAAMLFTGLIFGAVSQEYGAAIEAIDAFEQFLLTSEYFIFSMIAIMVAVVTLFTLQSLMRLRSEETGGPLESVLSTPHRRMSWMLSFIVFSLLGTLGLLVVFSLGAALAARSSGAETLEFVQVTLYHGCAVFALAGMVIALFGLLPRLVKGISWPVIMAAILAGPVFGPLLNLPDKVQNASPFTHVALLPGQTTTTALLILLLSGLFLTVLGLVTFSRRSLKL